ncbi:MULTISPECIES: DUF3618 domain-containing protein [unclassified Micromonospora]|uniref:DUF3618 domain-containing protein n=1 Tax=unclassified Micromonospora TaxID=2617518 RepID=UPI000EF4C5D1|nr:MULTISPECIES: DUF3618 domain-containing protein [unclassified Micromonospora]RLP91872.1 DUF3618 domain-containing protein [Micromonospora sp. BL4]RLQ00144.1 DUF3618 domain-containing protein [Micromonospora sp. CV4]
MSSDPDRIRREIETTRDELSNDVDALADRVNPRRIAGERVGQARDAVTRAKEKVMGSSSHMGQEASQRMSHVAGSVRDETRSLGQQSRGAMGSVRDEARSLGRQSREQTQGNPLAAGVVAFGVGLLAASLLPSTGRERQLAGRARGMVSEHSDQLRGQASQIGHQMQDNLREPAQQAAQSVRSTAEQGMSAVRDQGRSAAGQMQGQAHAAADDLRQR